jgi:GntR family transcriptional regulator/MocR family aminotransferase
MGQQLSATLWQELFAETADIGLHLQARVCRMIFSALACGLLQPGMAVPSSRALAQALGVGRNTVVLAYQQLLEERILQSQQRSGYFIHASFQLDHSDQKTIKTTASATHWPSRFKLALSQQRQLSKATDWDQYPYPFIYGQPDAEFFPVSAWRECCLKALSAKNAGMWSKDFSQQGDDPVLIQAICQHILPTRGILAQAAEILICVGSQHALYMLCSLLIRAQHVVGLEEPGYPDVRNMMLMHTTQLRALPVDSDGIVLDQVAQCDYLYLTPGRQCPTGASLSPQRRQKLLQLIDANDSIIIEDEYDAQVLVQNATIPALKSLDRHGRVIYVGSLSKPLAPGLRLGYIVADAALIAELRQLRRLMLRHPNILMQRVFAYFIQQGYYHSMLRRQHQLHQQRSALLLEALQQYFPQWQVSSINGGAACWIDTQSSVDTSILAKYAANRGVLIEAGQAFFLDPLQKRHLRLGIASIKTESIVAGIAQLHQALEEYRQYHPESL